MKRYNNFHLAIEKTRDELRYTSSLVHPSKWQSIDVSDKPDMATYEILNHSFQVPLFSENLEHLRGDIEPNLPWADDHFEERVGEEPLNPGEQWKNWPYAHSADRFRTEGEQFSHTYMERYWPKRAGNKADAFKPHLGIRYRYGDLLDVVDLLQREPLTRQAYLPIFFPEDTGVHHGERVPCTLGYHFIMRHGYLHCVYYIRSCDFVRHFRDDIYLTVRLQLWVLERMRKTPGCENVKPGTMTMHTTSMHMFRNDYLQRWGDR